MTAELHHTSVNMEGLLEVLGKNLYSTPRVAIRELVQNAHDACIRRKIEAQDDTQLFIRLSVDSSESTLTIEDNGSGLTEREVVEYLATIGSGYTRVLRNQTDTDEMIGYFGLGFLSAYVVASRVEVWTTSYKTPGETWYFNSKGGKQFTLSDASNREVGTKVKLKLKEDFSELLSVEILNSLLRKYCSLLPISIFVQDAKQAVNSLEVPWLNETDTSPIKLRQKRMAFASIFEENFKPLCVIPIPNENELGVRGLIWIQDASGYTTSDYRNVTVFIRNMYITHEGRDLLPLWAGFVGCVLESNALTPTASREDLQKDEAFEQLRDYLSHTLVNGLSSLAEQEPENWRRLLSRHNQALMGAAISDDQLFTLLKDDLKMPTTVGEMTMPVLLRQSKRTLYVRMEEKVGFEDILFRARMIPLVSGYMFAAYSFCRKYSDWHGIELVQLGTRKGESNFFKKEHPEPEAAAALAGLFQSDGEQVLFTRFEPNHIPLVIVEDDDIKLKKRIENDALDKKIGSAALSLARLHTSKIDSEINRRVYLNLNAPVISALTSDKINQQTKELASDLFKSFALCISQDYGSENLDFNQELRNFNDRLTILLGID